MKHTGRALGESFLFHGALVGIIVLIMGSFAQPKKIPIDFSLLEPMLSPSVKTPQGSKAQTVKDIPRPPQPVPKPSARPKITAKTPVKHWTPLPKANSPEIIGKVPAPKPVTERKNSVAQPSVAPPEPVTAPNRNLASSIHRVGAEHIASAQETIGPANDTSHLLDYLSLIRTKIEHHKRYPLWARRHRLEGEVSVRFVLTPNGQVAAVSILKSSGRDCLDEAAIEAVQEAAPMPEPPDGVLKKPTSMDLVIVFKLA